MELFKIMKFFIFVLVIAFAATIFKTLQIQGQSQQPTRDKSEQETQENEFSHYPVVRYDEPELGDVKEREKRKIKNKRYEKLRIVTKDSPSKPIGVGMMDKTPPPPAVPTTQSSVIVIGEVESAEAHLSNNKGEVYSEFSVRVDEVLKSDPSKPVSQGSVITFDMQGGTVLYPNGQKIIYIVVDKQLPHVGRRYLLFLDNSDESLNFNVKLGYELRNGKVHPLDKRSPFLKFSGEKETDFIALVRDAVTKPTQQVDNQ